MTQPDIPAVAALERLRDTSEDIRRFVLAYRSAIDEVETKVKILQREFSSAHEYNPIENVSSRLKTAESIRRKAERRGLQNLAQIREHVEDVAGVRVVCSFASDVYRVRDMLCAQSDLTLRREKDYIATPKPSGYRSLHLIVEVPVFLSDTVEVVPVEVQLRTIAMDFWASLEHKIHYKFSGDVPAELRGRLVRAADTAASLDADMQELHHEMQEIKSDADMGEDVVLGQMLHALALFERDEP